MKYFFISIFLIYNTTFLFADNEIGVSTNAIIEEYKTDFFIESDKSAKLKVKIRIKILNKNGDIFSEFSEYYDKYKRIIFFDGKIYDSNNKKIRRISIFDLNDNSLINNYSLYEDNRIKSYSPNISTYPYTIEYYFIITYSGIINYPTWQPLSDYNLEVKNAELNVHASNSLDVKYKIYNIDFPTIIDEKNNKIISWKLSNLNALESENNRVAFYYFTPTVFLAPNRFKIENYEGNMESWNSFGDWIHQLIEGQESLPKDAVLEIQNLTSDLSNKKDKAQRIYKYVQNRTRYVSIQLGIGGWKPTDATTVHKLGYGDCKALTNYTKSLLKVCGIESFYTLVKAGDNVHNIITDFPSNQFNHAILCVPLENDTIWLECTSQTSPFGYLGSFTDNRNVLLVKENESEIVKTPEYSQQDNTQNRSIEVFLNNKGDASCNITTNYEGVAFEEISYMPDLSKKRQEEILHQKLDLNNFSIDYHDFSVNKELLPTAHDSLVLSINNYATMSNSRMFIPLNLINKISYIPKNQKTRISPIKINYGFSDIDSIIYTYPDEYTIEYLPNNINITNEFGEYNVKIVNKNNTILYVRELKIKEGIYPSKDYDIFQTFYSEISKSDNIKCILKKNN